MQPGVVALLAVLVSPAACDDRRPVVLLQPKSGAPVKVFVEIADTPDTQTRGLMYRTQLEPEHGMIFVFDEEKAHPFWMKNTALSLDMIFISRDGHVVGIHANAEPFSLQSIDVGAPSRVVLEVNGGFAAAHGIVVGDTVSYRNVASKGGTLRH